MEQFEVFFAFYGLILGLAATEVLGSVGAMVRLRVIHRVRAQSALLAFLVFVVTCATWIDAWSSRNDFTLDFASLWAPIGAATAYYLAAVVVLPKEEATMGDIDAYFAERKRFVVMMLVAAEVCVKVTLLDVFAINLRMAPMTFWLYSLPLNLLIFGGYAFMYFARGRTANIVGILLQIGIFMIPYLPNNLISNAIRTSYGYPLIGS